VKRTPLEAFSNIRSTGIIATQFEEGDSLVDSLVTTGDAQILIATTDGLMIRFEESDIPISGRTAKGVTGIRLEEGSEVAGACSLPHRDGDKMSILTITRRAYGKRSSVNEFRVQKRGGAGIVGLKVNSKSGSLIGILPLMEEEDVMVTSGKGQAARLNAATIALQGRTTAGSRLARLEEGDGVASLTALRIEARAGQFVKELESRKK
jgi:DNA gyrase subunit A